MKNKVFILLFIFIFILVFDLMAQCPMCRTSVESAMAQGDTKGMGLNKGILYLMAFPYVIAFCTIGFYFYYKRKRNVKTSQQT